MTYAEAVERAKRIWGDSAFLLPRLRFDEHWTVARRGDIAVHRLDENGHVKCSHVDCVLAEDRLK